MCGDFIYSRSSHDFRWCSCGNVSIDNGPHVVGFYGSNHLKMNFAIKSMVANTVMEIKIPHSRNSEHFLRQDYNNSIDKYGVIEDESFTDEDLIAAKAKIDLIKG